MEDVQLVHALQTRQDGAMEQFQTAYTPLLRYIIAPILPDERDREECLSDVLLRVWDSIGAFDPGKAVLTIWPATLPSTAAGGMSAAGRAAHWTRPYRIPPTVRSSPFSKRKRRGPFGRRWSGWAAGTGSCSCANITTTSPPPRSPPNRA